MKKILNIFGVLCFLISRKVKMQPKHKRFVQCTEKMLWLTECVKSGLRSFLVLLTFRLNNSLLWGCLMHWKVFSSTPGLHPREANSGRQPTCSKYANQWSYWWKWKMCLILWNKPYRLSGQSSIFLYYKPRLWAFNFQSYSSTSTIF